MDRAEASRIAHGEFRLWNPLSEKARRARERMTMPGGRETLGFALVLMRRD